MNENWEYVTGVLYADGALIRTEIDRERGDVCLTMARAHDVPDESYVMTRQQANEIIYALSKALMQLDENEAQDDET